MKIPTCHSLNSPGKDCSSQTEPIRERIPVGRPLLILAPMQEVTDLAFWKVIHRYGDPDLYVTEYFRVHGDSRPERHILKSIDENPSGTPVLAQMIGQDIPALIRTAKWLLKHAVIGIDLNLGCPAPIVCRKNAGGGLLRQPAHLRKILRELRSAVESNFTVKTRIGYDDPDEFDRLVELFAGCSMDMLTVHGRTVREMYRTDVHFDRIAQAVQKVSCPVIANGNIRNVATAHDILRFTNASGLMIGRAAIRNPWIFRQIIESYEGGVKTLPTDLDLRGYIECLYEETRIPGLSEHSHVSKMKKYMNYIAPGRGKGVQFLEAIRRCVTPEEFFKICDDHLDSGIELDTGLSGVPSDNLQVTPSVE